MYQAWRKTEERRNVQCTTGIPQIILSMMTKINIKHVLSKTMLFSVGNECSKIEVFILHLKWWNVDSSIFLYVYIFIYYNTQNNHFAYCMSTILTTIVLRTTTLLIVCLHFDYCSSQNNHFKGYSITHQNYQDKNYKIIRGKYRKQN